MTRATLLTLLLAAAAAFPAAAAGEDGTYLLVVNANNRFSDDPDAMKVHVKRMYLGFQTSWPGSDAKSVPYGRPEDSEARAAFLQSVLDMSEAELRSHWLRLKQTTGEAAPEDVSSARSLLRSIARDEGAFSVVSEDEARKLPAKVRVLFRFSPDD